MATIDERVLHAVALGSSSTTLFLDADLVIQWISQSCEALLGWPPQSAVGRSGIEFVHPDDLPELFDLIQAELIEPTDFAKAGGGRMALRPFRLLTPIGSYRCVDASIGNYVNNPAVNGYILQIVDAEVRQADLRAYQAIVETIDPVTAITAIANALSTKLDGAKVLVEALNTTNAIDAEEIAELHATDALLPHVLRHVVEHPSNPLRSFSITAVDRGGVAFNRWAKEIIGETVMLINHLIERERNRELLSEAARTDPLTGLANRRGFDASFAVHTDRRAHVANGTSALLFIDLDRFKAVNDDYGHEAGDHVLAVAAYRLKQIVRSTDSVARIGGDEFCVLAETSSANAARELGERIVQIIRQPINVNPTTSISIGATVGIAVTPNPLATRDLLRRADELVIAMKRDRNQQVDLVSI